jgi:hypothetical protein
MDLLLTWLPAVLAAVACGLMTFAWAGLILAWGSHVHAGIRREQWLPGPTSQIVEWAAIAIWLLAVAGGGFLTGPSADLGRTLIALGSVVLGLVAVIAVWFASALTQDIDRFRVGSMHPGACGGRLQPVRTNQLACETCGVRFRFGDATVTEQMLHLGGCGGRLQLLSHSCEACGTTFTWEELRRTYDEVSQVPPSRLDTLLRSGATMTYGAVGGAVAGVVVASAVASWAWAGGGFAALAVAVIGAVGAPVLFVFGVVAVAFAGI